MKKILAFAGSNSSTSINHKLVSYVASNLSEFDTRVVNLIDYQMPMYSEDEEKANGFPGMLLGLLQQISEADAIIISVNEHNGSWSAFFKNIMDWVSRKDRSFLEGKKVLLMSTSPGKRGGLSALEFSKNVFPRFGAEIVDSFSFPSFYDNFSTELNEVKEETLRIGLASVITNFAQQL